MPKIVLRRTIISVHEYEANPSDYPDCNTPEEMARSDQEDVTLDPETWVAEGKLIITVEVLPIQKEMESKGQTRLFNS